MFAESLSNVETRGWIEVICGCMFSGKTEELIRRVKRAEIANRNVAIFKPAIDTRYHEEEIISHDENVILSTAVENANAILLNSTTADVIGIDEAQFFDSEIVSVCNHLANQGKRIIVAGLDMDFSGRPFGPMPGLLAIAEHVTKLQAVCARCGNNAIYSYRRTHHENQVLIGEKDIYEPRCRLCYNLRG
ncbi:MAG TPA: thymidine kinase [Agriterribacter sp.]|nr:thymidine kinase [Agriterribacter sp.]